MLHTIHGICHGTINTFQSLPHIFLQENRPYVYNNIYNNRMYIINK